MALSLKKHEENIVQAWKSVLDEKNLCDWVLFGYDGQSNELKVESTGKYGLEELSQEFNPGKVLFAFCKVKNPKSNLPLFILINWVGEGAPLNRKSSSPQHLFTIQKFLKYSSLTINARVEDDVEPEAILERIKKTSTTDFDFSAKIQNECLENIGPISTNYVRIKPEKDINLNEKKKFWSNLEKEFDEIKKEKELKEKETKENERNLINNRLNNKNSIVENNNSNDDLVVKKINKLKINSELSEREKFWAQEEEEENKQKKEENKKKLLEKKAIEVELKNRELSAKLIMNNFNNLSSNDVKIKKINAIDEINLEKKKLLSSIKNSINDNEISENNSLTDIESESQNNNQQNSENQNFNEPSLEDYVNELNETYVKEADLSNDLYDNYLDDDKNIDDEDVDDEAYENEYCLDDKSLKLSPDYLSKRLFFEPLEDIQEEDEDCQDEEYQEEDKQEEDCLNEELQKFLEGKGKCAKALFDYQASDDTEISFDPNDIITNINQVFESWWEGLGPDNKLGLFPANYVQLLN